MRTGFRETNVHLLRLLHGDRTDSEKPHFVFQDLFWKLAFGARGVRCGGPKRGC